jgi:hypothetical protein
MIGKFIKWFIRPSSKPIVEDVDVYSKLFELEEKYKSLLLDVKRLEEENIETSNVLYELGNSIDAVDARIDILTLRKWSDDNV